MLLPYYTIGEDQLVKYGFQLVYYLKTENIA